MLRQQGGETAKTLSFAPIQGVWERAKVCGRGWKGKNFAAKLAERVFSGGTP
jgi:hypothetical protein